MARSPHVRRLRSERAALGSDGFEELRSAWRTLDHRSAPNVFLTFEWIDAWWQAFADGDERYLILVRDDAGALVGVAPLMRTVTRLRGDAHLATMRFVGHTNSDRLGFLSAAGHEQAVAESVVAFLRDNHADWDVLQFTNLVEGSPELSALHRAFARDHIYYLEPGLSCPYLPIEVDWEGYLSTRSRRFRAELRRGMRRFVNDLGGRLQPCDDPVDLHRALEFLFQHKTRRLGTDSRAVSAYVDRRMQLFHLDASRRLLALGRVECTLLEIDGAIAAVNYNLRHGGKVWGQNMAFDDRWRTYGLGRLLLAMVVERAFTSGMREYDFLLGSDAYKQRWATHTRTHWHASIVQRAPLAIASTAVPLWWRALKRRVKHIAPEAFVRFVQRNRRSIQSHKG